MKDRLQKIADRLCSKFGLNRVRVGFAEEFTADDIKLYNFIFCSSFTFDTVVDNAGRWKTRKLREQLALIPKIENEELAKAKKNILWKEFITNPKQQSLAGMIVQKEVRILGAAIDICKAKFKDINVIAGIHKLKADELILAKGIANKMEQFHDVKGVVLQEFKDILKAIKGNVGKMPLIKGGASVFEQYVHETIHYILSKNGIKGDKGLGQANEAFGEGICTYLHFRFRWSRAWFFRMYLFGRGAVYKLWSKYFKFIFQNVPDREIGPLLKKNQKKYAFELAKGYKPPGLG
jgi:hypothetical protein